MATTTLTPVKSNASQTNITEKTMCVNISIGFIGNHRKLSTAQIEVDAEKTMITASKKLFDSKELKAINKADNQLKGWLRARCLPSLFKNGIYLVPLGAVQEVTNRLKAAKEKRVELVEAFCKVYADEKEKSMERLRSVASSHDYPHISKVRAAFGFEWSWVNFSTPSKLKEISVAFFEEEKAKAAANMMQATEEIRQLQRQQISDLVDHLVEVLTPSNDGKVKRFRTSAVTKISTFLDGFSIMNVTDDAELDKVLSQAKALVAGVDPKNVKKDDAAKNSLLSGFSAIKKSLGALIVEGGERAIDLEEE